MAIQTTLGRFRTLPGVAGVAGVFLLVPLLARKNHLFHIHDHDEIAGIDMGCVCRAVFAHQNNGDFSCQPADHLVGGVDEPPFLLDLARFGHVRFHNLLLRCPGRKGGRAIAPS